MFKSLLRIGLLGYVWTSYKRVIISTLCLFIYFWLAGKLHQDYVNYGELNDDTEFLGLSFVLKWIAFILGFLAYLALNTLVRSKNETIQENVRPEAKGRSDANKASAFKRWGQSSGSLDVSGTKASVEAEDPFASIRNKKVLRSKGDFIIQNDEKNKDG